MCRSSHQSAFGGGNLVHRNVIAAVFGRRSLLLSAGDAAICSLLFRMDDFVDAPFDPGGTCVGADLGALRMP